MPYVQQGIIVGLVLLVTGMAWAGGSNYGITPGSRPQVAGKISEWQVPTPKFARDPAPGPDGNIYISVMHGNKIARFDTHTQTFHEWDLPQEHNRMACWSTTTARCGTRATATAPSGTLIRPPGRWLNTKPPQAGTRIRWCSLTRV